jgi:CheY-like chemotaxis protein
MPGPRILLVDDYIDSLEVWALYLSTEGFDVSTATNGRTALEIVGSRPLDVIVMDLDLPGMTGIEVARVLRAQASSAHIPLIAVTGHTGSRLDAARTAGFDAALVKPCAPDALMSQIRRLLPAEPAS